MPYKAKGYTRSDINPKKPYHAQICISGKTIGLGYYKTEKQAHAAYVKARKANPPIKLKRKQGSNQ